MIGRLFSDDCQMGYGHRSVGKRPVPLVEGVFVDGYRFSIAFHLAERLDGCFQYACHGWGDARRYARRKSLHDALDNAEVLSGQ